MYYSTFNLVSGIDDPDINLMAMVGDNFLMCEDESTLLEKTTNPALTVNETIERLRAIKPEVLVAAGIHAASNYKRNERGHGGGWECITPDPKTGKIDRVDIERSYMITFLSFNDHLIAQEYNKFYNAQSMPLLDGVSPIPAGSITLNTTYNPKIPRLMWKFTATVNNVQQIFIGLFMPNNEATP